MVSEGSQSQGRELVHCIVIGIYRQIIAEIRTIVRVVYEKVNSGICFRV